MVFLSKKCLLGKASSEWAKRSISKDESLLSKFLYFYNYKESKGLNQFFSCLIYFLESGRSFYSSQITMWTLLSKSGQEAYQSKAAWGAYLPVRTCDRDRGQLEVMTYSLREDNLVDDLGEDFLTRKPKMNFRFFGVAVKRRKLLPQWRLQAPIRHSYSQIHMKRTRYIFPLSSFLHFLCEPIYRWHARSSSGEF